MVHYAKGRCKVIAGTGANSTEEAVYLTKSAEYAGGWFTAGESVLQQAFAGGLYAHFSEIANSPTCRSCSTAFQVGATWRSVSTVARLAADCPNIVCIKEAGGDADRVSQLRAGLPKNFPSSVATTR